MLAPAAVPTVTLSLAFQPQGTAKLPAALPTVATTGAPGPIIPSATPYKLAEVRNIVFADTSHGGSEIQKSLSEIEKRTDASAPNFIQIH